MVLKSKDLPKTLIEFEERFASEADCREYLTAVRWPNGFCCPKCQSTKSWLLEKRLLFQCSRCKKQVSLTAGTIFHKSRKPLRLWFRAIFLITCTKTGISARQLARQLGVRYPTAWTWLHKIRTAMVRPERDLLRGVIEIDDAYFGGHEIGVRGRKTESKVPVAVAIEEAHVGSGRVRMSAVKDVTSDTLLSFVEKNVTPKSTVKTDGWSGYGDLRKRGFDHQPKTVGDPKRASQLLPRVHRVISLAKRFLLGTYQGAVRKGRHFQRYLNEFTFRFNRRTSKCLTLPFQRACEIAVVARPPTYRQLITQVMEAA